MSTQSDSHMMPPPGGLRLSYEADDVDLWLDLPGVLGDACRDMIGALDIALRGYIAAQGVPDGAIRVVVTVTGDTADEYPLALAATFKLSTSHRCVLARAEAS